MVTAGRQIITLARLGIFEVTYGKHATFENSRIDIFSFLHFSDCLCAFWLFQSRTGNSPSNLSAVDPPGKSSDALPAAYGQAEGSNVMSAVSGSSSGAAGNNCAENTDSGTNHSTHKRCRLCPASAGELQPPASCCRPVPICLAPLYTPMPV